MGLAVAHGIISGLGGEIAVDSTAGKGTSFKISIPLQESDSEDEISRTEDIGTKRILYLDNNVHFSRTVSLALEKLNYDVRLISEINDLKKNLDASKRIDYVFLRCDFDDDEKKQMLETLFTRLKESKIILITQPGVSTYRKVLKLDRERITILSEPITLREIVNSIQ